MLTTEIHAVAYKRNVTDKIAKIHQNKTPIRRHFIKEWAEARDLKPADITEALGVDKSQVSRWYNGQMPQPDTQRALAAFFHISPEALLRHPDDDWIARFFSSRTADERERIKKTIEAAFPLKTGTDE